MKKTALTLGLLLASASSAFAGNADLDEVDPGFSVGTNLTDSRVLLSNIIAYVLIFIGVAAIVASIIILRKKKAKLRK